MTIAESQNLTPAPANEPSYFEHSREEAIKQATEDGLTVVYGNDLTLQIDIDSPERLELCRALLKIADNHNLIGRVTRRESKTVGHWHIIVDLWKELKRPERYALQSMLGSDPARELLNTIFAKNNEGECFLFMQMSNPISIWNYKVDGQ